MKPALMTLRILVPTGIFMVKKNVERVIAESQDGSFGLLPHRFDCLASLVPGVLTFVCQNEGENFVAINEGVLVKTGMEVVISVRNAIMGKELSKLHRAVQDQFLNLDQAEMMACMTMSRMESSFVKRMAEMKK